ncbi:Sentrin-specific protease [Ooceraea biroi]|uniref:Sentrin-specific protease n=1 Tax=Ooceraea biroi TaxID=2015173 RepID=A0A026X2H8_OOCBI|nr:Sentrin-specific protease [Ooceraea biroi]
MTIIFDFLKKIFGWVDEGCKKRKAPCNDDHFEEEYVTPKKFKSNYNTLHMMGDYFDIEDSDDDDIVFLGEQKCSPVKSCVKLNGTHKKQPSYQFHNTLISATCKTTCNPTCKSTHYSNCCNKPTMSRFVDYNHQIQDSSHRCTTLSKTNQLKERHQYEELLQNFLPNRIHILKDKRVDTQKPIEVIDLDSTEAVKNNTRPIVVDITEPVPSYYRRSSVPTCSRVDKETVPTSVCDRKDAATTLQYSKVLDKPNTSGTLKPTSTPRLPVKVAATNSLRDELAAKAVMRQDFIPQVAKRYNERIEQRHREAEELKRMTCVLSKHNRYAREAALEEQLARSMKLCLAVLDDRDEPEEPALPKLTDEMLREVKNALVHSPGDEVLAEGFGLRITRKDLHTLAGLNWLNDEVINFYMNLLIARGHSSDKYPKVHAMNTFFYPKLLSGGHACLRRWTRKVDIFAQDVVVVPVHLDIHWCMSIIDFRDKSIVYYDSMGGSNPKCLTALKQYLLDESMDKKKQTYDMSDWKLHSAKKIPQQMNGSDCGVFSCMFAEFVCANKKITFTQEDMPYFRNKMVYEILKGKLL